ncbi:MAG: hypothetical protein ACJ8GO_19425 [Ramlibacter sp.]
MPMLGRTLMVVAWPAFLAACLLEVLVFAVVDPLDLRWAGHSLGWSRADVYTIAFFAFWAASMGGCALSSFLWMAPAEINAQPEAD